MAISKKGVDSGWSGMADLMNKISGKVEVKILFFDKRVKA